MDADELASTLPRLLEAWYPGQSQALPPPMGWVIEEDGLVALLRVSNASNPFLWLRIGVAKAIPISDSVGTFVAMKNRDLMVGRAYLGRNDEWGSVVIEETVFARSLSLEHMPSFQDLADRLATAFGEAGILRGQTFEAFGGLPFAHADWTMLTF